MQWEAREYEPGDEGQILRLFGEAFGSQRSLGHWKWEFLEGPAGPGVIRLAWAGNRLVGQYAIVPVRMTIGGKSILGAQSVDTMTASDFRRQGIFEDLARRTFKKARDLGIELVYGFPNRNSYQGFVKKLDFVSVAPVRELRYRLDWRRFVDDRRPKSIAKSLADEYLGLLRASEGPRGRIEAITEFTKENDILWREASETLGLGVAKTADYLNWRYRAFPDVSYRILQTRADGVVKGFAVWTDNGPLATLVDLVASSDGVAGHLLQSVMRDARAAGCGFLRAWEVPRAGDRPSRLPRSPSVQEPTVLIAFSPTGTYTKEDLGVEADWCLQMGDSDGV